MGEENERARACMAAMFDKMRVTEEQQTELNVEGVKIRMSGRAKVVVTRTEVTPEADD